MLLKGIALHFFNLFFDGKNENSFIEMRHCFSQMDFMMGSGLFQALTHEDMTNHS